MPEDTALFTSATHSSDHLAENGIIDDYMPVNFTPSDNRVRSDGSLSPPQTEGTNQRLLDAGADSAVSVSPALSYYSASAIPTSASGETRHTASSPPSTPQRRPSIPHAVVHESRSHPSLGSDGGEFEMRVRSSLTSSSPSGPPPRTPDGTRPGIRERQESYVASPNITPARSPNPDGPSVVHEEEDEDGADPPWSGAIAL